MTNGTKKKKQIQFRYYEIPQDEPCLALLGEAWERPYGDGVDCSHFHNYMEIGFCYDGDGEIVLNEESVPYKADMFTIIPKNYPHNTNSTDFGLSRWEYLFIDAEVFLREMYKDNQMFADALIQIINSRAWTVDAAKYPETAALIHNIMEEMRYKKDFYVESVHGLILSLLMNIARMNHKGSGKVKKQSIGVSQMTVALHHIGKHYAEDLTIGDLAVVSHMSETHFRRVFQKTMNMTPSDYLNLVRIQMACEYMRKHTDSMELVAERCGFQSVSTFNRNFKKILGITPYQWKIHPENYEAKLLNYKISAYRGW
ncbi:MAG: AraC family transcriptional regulator [Eubacterium sp.]|nr:AraC family transcriptional regulator [Eubacterium sp.]